MGNYVANLATMADEIRTQSTCVIVDIVRELDRRRNGDNYGQAEALTSHAAHVVLGERYAADTADWTHDMRIRFMSAMPNTQPDPAARCLSDAITRPLAAAYPDVEDVFMDAWHGMDSPDEDAFPTLLAAAYATAAGVILPQREPATS